MTLEVVTCSLRMKLLWRRMRRYRVKRRVNKKPLSLKKVWRRFWGKGCEENENKVWIKRSVYLRFNTIGNFSAHSDDCLQEFSTVWVKATKAMIWRWNIHMQKLLHTHSSPLEGEESVFREWTLRKPTRECHVPILSKLRMGRRKCDNPY